MKRFDIDDVVIHTHMLEDIWIFKAEWHGNQVGEAKCACGKGRILLSDIESKGSLEVYSNIIDNLLAKTGCIPKKYIKLQRRGIGTKLLAEVIKCFHKSDMDELYGFIIESDEQQIPELRNWYRKNDFDILPIESDCTHSDSDCTPPNSVARIVMRKLQ